MKLVDRIGKDMTDAMRAKDQQTLSTLRMLKTALVNRRIEKGRGLEDPEAQAVVGSLVKQRRDSIEQFTKGGRQDLADKEAGEIRVLERYLPPAAGADEIERAVEAAIAETGATSAKDLGRVMKAVMPKLAGRQVDGRTVNEAVRRRLGA